MHVMMLSWEYPPHIEGGLGEHVTALVRALAAMPGDFGLHLIAPVFAAKGWQETQGRLSVHRVAVAKPNANDYYGGVWQANQTLAGRARALLAQETFDLIHVHDWLVGFAGRSLQAVYGIPLLSTIHATEQGRHGGHLYNDLQRAIDGAERQLVQESYRVITCSQAMAGEVERLFAVPADRVEVIPNGVDANRFAYLADESLEAFRAGYARPEEQIVFNVGRVVYEKGADLLVEAARRVLSRAPQAKFVIAGRGPMLASLQRRVQQLRLTEKVLLTGYVSDEDRDRLYLLADCCVFPSRYEPFGIVALESMAAGAPVVATGVGGLASVVADGETGVVVDSEDVEALTNGILYTLQDRAAAEQRARRASAVVRQCFSWDVVAAMTLDVYRRVVQPVGAET